MKKLLIVLCGLLLTSTVWAQQEEPDFVGEVLLIRADGSSEKLDKSISQIRTRVNAGALLVGIGKAKTKVVVDGVASATQIKVSETGYRFIVRAVDNQTDPLAIIRIFRFKPNKKQRLAEIASVSTFGSVKSNKLDYLNYKAKKYGAACYEVTLDEPTVGCFGITVSNPNNLDEKQMIISTFDIVE